MHIGLATVVCLASCEDHLKAQAPVRHGRHGHGQGVYVLTMVLLVPVGELFAHPALEVRDVAG
jgi:hypothetical protein